MKKVILTAAAVFAFGFMNAQSTKFGLKAGADFTSATITLGDANTGFYMGGFADVTVSKKFHVQPELLYVSVKDLDQIQVPILAKFPVVEDFCLLAGPDLGFLLNAGSGLKTFNFGLDLGTSLDVSENFSLDAKYNFGLTNLVKVGNSEKLNGFFFGLGYKF
jgi:hypothetical protein